MMDQLTAKVTHSQQNRRLHVAELEHSVDDGPIDDNELDGPENGEDEDCDSAEPTLGSLDGQTDQTAWAAGGRADLELDGAESGIADLNGLLE